MIRRYAVTLWVGLKAEMPEPGERGRIFFAEDERRFYWDALSAWLGHTMGVAVAGIVQFAQAVPSLTAATWTDVYATMPAEPVDATGRTEFRLTAVWAVRSAQGVQDLRWTVGADVLHTFAGLTGGMIAQSLDSGWLPLPAWARGEMGLLWQCRSTRSDSPYAYGWKLTVR